YAGPRVEKMEPQSPVGRQLEAGHDPLPDEVPVTREEGNIVKEFTPAHRAALSVAQKARRAKERGDGDIQVVYELCTYIAGGMSGHKDGNRLQFIDAAADLRGR